MKKFKNALLKITTAVAAITFMICVCALDSENNVPAIMAFASLGYLTLIGMANRDRLEDFEEDDYGEICHRREYSGKEKRNTKAV